MKFSHFAAFREHKNNIMDTQNTPPEKQLVDAKRLLEILFDEQSRPSSRWLRQMQAQRVIPYYKLGRLVRFDVDEVRKALFEERLVKTRSTIRRMG